MPKIAVYAISKNEEKFVERFCGTARDADLVMIADTGSTDNTVQEARDNGAVVHEICVTPWRFDIARNAALALVPANIDICVSLDLDEVLTEGWRAEIERVWVLGETTRLRYGFNWGHDIIFRYEKIHARNGYRWHHPCHEYPVPDRIEEVWAESATTLVVHLADNSKSRGSYLDLLRLSIKEDPHCPRNAFYFARELMFNRLWQEAIEQCQRYLDLPGATWVNERCYAMRVIGQSCAAIGQVANSLAWYRRATAEAPNTREPWCELALICHKLQRWEECYSSAKTALSITNREEVYTQDPLVWGARPHDLAAIAAWNLGLKKEAIFHGQNAVKLAPEDQRLVTNVVHFLKDSNNEE